MHILLVIPVIMLFLVVPPASIGAGWYFGKAKKHGRFRKEYERSIFRLCLVLLTLLIGGFYIFGFAEALGHSSPYRSGFRNFVEIGFATVLFGVVYLFGLWFSHCAVVGVRRTFPKGSRLLVYLGVLLGGTLGPLGLGLLSLMGFKEPRTEGETTASAMSKASLVARMFMNR